jgi:prepilin-type N-terminal cleavage/methylation domain-containing protein
LIARLGHAPRGRRAQLAAARGFTMAELAVTLVIVSVGMLLVLQGLSTAKLSAAHTRNLKLARELGSLTLGQVGAGLYAEEIDRDQVLTGSYAEQGHPEFAFEIALGDEDFRTRQRRDAGEAHDSWAKTEQELRDEEKEEEDEIEQPYEKVRVLVSFPPIKEMSTELVHAAPSAASRWSRSWSS